MNLFDAYMSNAGLPTLLATCGRSVWYRHEGCGDTPLTALVGDEQAVSKFNSRGQRQKSRCRSFTFLRDPQSDFHGVRDPKIGAKCIYAGITYVITEITQQDEVSTQVKGERSESRQQLAGSGE